MNFLIFFLSVFKKNGKKCFFLNIFIFFNFVNYFVKQQIY